MYVIQLGKRLEQAYEVVREHLKKLEVFSVDTPHVWCFVSGMGRWQTG